MDIKILMLVCLCFLLSKTSAQTTQAPRILNLRCIFRIQGTDYDCLIDQAATVNDLNANIVFYGVHQAGRNHNSVTRLLITNSFMPLVLREAIFSFPTLRTYSFTNGVRTNMKRIQSGAFVNATTLNDIIITNAGLAMIGPNSFNGATNVRRLELQNNHLTDLPDNMLHPMNQLEIVNLSNNNLAFIQNNMFFQSPRLTQINLSNNQLTQLSAQLLATNRPSIAQFHAEHNRISQIGFQFLTVANTALTHLSLFGNVCINVNWHNIGSGTTIQQVITALTPCNANV